MKDKPTPAVPLIQREDGKVQARVEKAQTVINAGKYIDGVYVDDKTIVFNNPTYDTPFGSIKLGPYAILHFDADSIIIKVVQEGRREQDMEIDNKTGALLLWIFPALGLIRRDQLIIYGTDHILAVDIAAKLTESAAKFVEGLTVEDSTRKKEKSK
jgi:hypothetical protein